MTSLLPENILIGIKEHFESMSEDNGWGERIETKDLIKFLEKVDYDYYSSISVKEIIDLEMIADPDCTGFCQFDAVLNALMTNESYVKKIYDEQLQGWLKEGNFN